MTVARDMLGISCVRGALLHYADDVFGFSLDRLKGNARAGLMFVLGIMTGLPMTKIALWTREPIFCGIQYMLAQCMCRPKPSKMLILEEA